MPAILLTIETEDPDKAIHMRLPFTVNLKDPGVPEEVGRLIVDALKDWAHGE